NPNCMVVSRRSKNTFETQRNRGSGGGKRLPKSPKLPKFEPLMLISTVKGNVAKFCFSDYRDYFSSASSFPPCFKVLFLMVCSCYLPIANCSLNNSSAVPAQNAR